MEDSIRTFRKITFLRMLSFKLQAYKHEGSHRGISKKHMLKLAIFDLKPIKKTTFRLLKGEKLRSKKDCCKTLGTASTY